MQKIVIASSNPGKLKELAELLRPLDIEAVPQSAFDVPEAEEPHPTFIENALAKARHASRHAGLPALADDSGICVEALGGAPGVHSARYAADLDPDAPSSDARNNQKLVQALAGASDRRAHYYCVLVLVRHPDDPAPLIAEGVWHGEIAGAPLGIGGFGYDPYFFLTELGKTAAELSAVQKNAISHRGVAMQSLLEKLKASLE